MLAGVDEGYGSVLLREHCLQRLTAVYREIDRLHIEGLLLRDAELALQALRQQCQEQMYNVATASSDKALRTACGASLLRLREVLVPMLGMIVRSSNLRLAFELYYPLKRLVAILSGRNVEAGPVLLLSSDWHYYPDTHVGQSQDIVILGFPAVESSNSLIVPLFGHELGHNIWFDKSLKHEFDTRVSDLLRDMIVEEYWSEFLSQDFGPVKVANLQHIRDNDPQVADVVKNLATIALGQLEEYFCDAVGLRLFSEAYLKSLGYLCLPGFPQQNAVYPQFRDRLRRLESLSGRIAVDWCVDASQCYNYSVGGDAKSSIVRSVVELLIDDVQQLALDVLDNRLVPRRDPARVEHIADQFRKLVPASGRQNLTDLINAAWLVSHEQQTAHRYGLEMARWRDVVNQMTLKSCEVSEYHERVDLDADAK